MSDTNYEIELQQNKLADIISAINREQQTLQDKQIEKKDLEKEIKALGVSRDNADNELKTSKDTLESYSVDRQAEIKELSDTKQTLSNDIIELEKKKAGLKIDIERDTEDWKNKVIDKQREYDMIEANIKTMQEGLASDTVRLTEEMNKAKEDTDKAIKDKQQADKVLAGVMEEIKTKTGELNNLTIQAIQRMNEVDDSSNQLQKSTELRNTLLEEIAALTAEKETMTTGITTLKEELDGLEEEKTAIKKEKIQLAKIREMVEQKEEFIRNKYESAGIKF